MGCFHKKSNDFNGLTVDDGIQLAQRAPAASARCLEIPDSFAATLQAQHIRKQPHKY